MNSWASYEIHAQITTKLKITSYLPFPCSTVRSKFPLIFLIFRKLILCFYDFYRKGYISTSDLKEVFALLEEQIEDDDLNTMIKIAGTKSNDKINFKEFVDFFYKIDWYPCSHEEKFMRHTNTTTTQMWIFYGDINRICISALKQNNIDTLRNIKLEYNCLLT